MRFLSKNRMIGFFLAIVIVFSSGGFSQAAAPLYELSTPSTARLSPPPQSPLQLIIGCMNKISSS